MDAFARALADPVGRSVYLVFCFLLLVEPMIALALWHHARIRHMPAGHAVMKEQARIGVRTHRFWQAVGFGREIAAGRYGADVGQMQGTVYRLVGVWLLFNVIAWGLLFCAAEANRP